MAEWIEIGDEVAELAVGVDEIVNPQLRVLPAGDGGSAGGFGTVAGGFTSTEAQIKPGEKDAPFFFQAARVAAVLFVEAFDELGVFPTDEF
jgi:hypothetical protein